MVVPPVTAEKKRNWGVIAAFAALVAIIVTLLFLVLKDSDDQAAVAPESTPTLSTSPTLAPIVAVTPSPSPSVTPIVTAAPADPPPPSGPRFDGFSAPSSVACASVDDFQQVTITWVGSGAINAWVGVATSNAKAEPFESVSTSGSATLPFPCGNASQLYTVTLEDADGVLKHKSVTITRTM